MISEREKKRIAFTLIELLVVIAIIALLVSILLPSLKRAQSLAKRAVCGANMHSLTLSTLLYANDHNELPGRSGYSPYSTNYFWPGYGDFWTMIELGYIDEKSLDCPDGVIHERNLVFSDYCYFGQQTNDLSSWIGPARDIDGNPLNLAESLDSPSDAILFTDASAAITGFAGATSPDFGYEGQAHPGWWCPVSWQFAPIPREGLNVGTLDGSVLWKDEEDTTLGYKCGATLWLSF